MVEVVCFILREKLSFWPLLRLAIQHTFEDHGFRCFDDVFF